MTTTEATYAIGDIVFLRVRNDKLKGMVTGIMIRSTGQYYNVHWGDGSDTWHYPFELTTEYVPDFKEA